jgi:hypothetical protein
VLLFGLGTLVVYLTLSAQYELRAALHRALAVPMAPLGAIGAQWLAAFRTTSSARSGW